MPRVTEIFGKEILLIREMALIIYSSNASEERHIISLLKVQNYLVLFQKIKAQTFS